MAAPPPIMLEDQLSISTQHVCELIDRAERLLEQLIAVKAALECEQDGRQEQASSPHIATSQNSEVEASIRSLALIAQDSLAISASHLPLVDSSVATFLHGVDSAQSLFGEPSRGSRSPPQTALTPPSRIAPVDLSALPGQIRDIPPSPIDHAEDVPATSTLTSTVKHTSPEIDPREPKATQIMASQSPDTSIIESKASVTSGARKQLPSASGLSREGSEASVGIKKHAASDCSSDHPAKKPRVRVDTNVSVPIPVSQELQKLIMRLQYHDKLCRIPLFPIADPPSTIMMRRVAAAQGGPAIRQFCSLIHQRRSRETEIGLFNIGSKGIERALGLSKSVGIITRKTIQGAFLIRLIQYHIAEAVDGSKAGRLRADSSNIKETMDKFRLTEAERPKFFQFLKQGRQWRSICGRFPGLLCLIPLRTEKPYCVSPTDYLSMKGDELDRFASLINSPYMARLSEACEEFQKMVMGTREDSVYKWENEHPGLYCWDKTLDDDILLSLLQPHPTCEANLIDMEEFPEWPKPTGWPSEWPWPANPLGIVPWDRQCDFCEESRCSCVAEKLQARRPRIKSYGSQGLGLQAVAANEGEVAYTRGEVIGQLGGKLVPADTHAHNSLWVVGMHRPDISRESNVCQIYVGATSNCFRNLNHCCRASARMRPLRASGSWVMAVEAVRDIRHGEQLTINFGKKFLRDQGLRCECEVCVV
ncbi:hypothetical protein G7Z17_g809 [Cylindrodendrum hubeiense]|uniref:SET domain-containing protein n=1 Tax=Cylindrodendrum hubeiense TaxID=595255 RepID=A0A9P5HG24_9HYPO|nr:hypothetical protein G7Z17_g809 [Cylindrodendrum hubeiense]